ncbi:beta-catenin-interacting protein 1 [Gasterosteus aculeatus]|uniref:Beta-catenin-interacting protein 1 n=3 Tax=Gasterosteidae TaxID=69291 RepID=A0AAQ4PT32_GASAC
MCSSEEGQRFPVRWRPLRPVAVLNMQQDARCAESVVRRSCADWRDVTPEQDALPTTTHHSNRAQKKEKLDQEGATGAGGMNREEAPGKSPEDMYIQQKVRVLLMLKKMGSNLTPSEEAFLRSYAGVVHSQMSQLPQHNIDQGAEDVVMAFSRSEAEDRRQ